MSGGETELGELLAGLAPELLPEEYVFCTLPERKLAPEFSALATFQEEEGLSVVLERSGAQRLGFGRGAVMRCISLGAHSSLEAVGLTAAVAGRLAGLGISANVIAAYFHDHVLVPAERAEEALEALLAMRPESGGLNRRKQT